MNLDKGYLSKSISIKRSPIIRRNRIITYQYNPMTNIVIGVITFGVLYDVSTTLLKPKTKIKRDVVEPIVMDEEQTEEDEFMSKKEKIPSEMIKDDPNNIIDI